MLRSKIYTDNMLTAEPRLKGAELVLAIGCSNSFLVDITRLSKRDKRAAYIRPSFEGAATGCKYDQWLFPDVVKVAVLWNLRNLGIDRKFFPMVIKSLNKLGALPLQPELQPLSSKFENGVTGQCTFSISYFFRSFLLQGYVIGIRVESYNEAHHYLCNGDDVAMSSNLSEIVSSTSVNLVTLNSLIKKRLSL